VPLWLLWDLSGSRLLALRQRPSCAGHFISRHFIAFAGELDPLGEPIPHATVVLFRGGVQQGELKTGEDGTFSFDQKSAGNYVLRVAATGFKDTEFSIVVAKPQEKCKQALEIKLNLGYPEACTNVRIVKR
jgi:hypothetical protein